MFLNLYKNIIKRFFTSMR